MNIFIEATGGLTSGYLIKAIQEAGHKVFGSDISDFNHAKILCDSFIIMPKITDIELWEKTTQLLKDNQINIVIPSFDETMLQWADRIDYFEKLGIKIIISPLKTIKIFEDKWKTYEFFKSINIPTPNTSLHAQYPLIKPRLGRGGSGIFTNDFKNDFSMEGYISQEIIEGIEYTIDTFFDKDHNPIYIVPRKRIDIKDGKSTKGIVVKHPKIEKMILDISKDIDFIGPINFQLFETADNKLIFIEINPRIAGGMALGFAATENWIPLIINNILHKEKINPKPIKYGLKMIRYYNELFI